MKIIFATGNQNKMREVREIMEGTGYEIVSMKEAGIESDPEETGATFEENVLIKARDVAVKLSDEDKGKVIVLADDSGLEVDYMDKAPGVYSARFMGHETSYDIKNNAILEKLEGVPEEKRTARFVCAIGAIFPDGKEEVVLKTMEGKIGHKISGANGFGYDPIFIPEGYDVTSADISPEEKNKISHRGKALRKMKELLTKRM
ncbi:MAG: RdgB/HAM1 family non-canonical purine NTP pyrophosphatase [Lachnospiraceae bacterium]|nr:RdgB/HAM1 family non-canonical purine NTP pyrophosphatase [Lachnospiraceae bacterium]